MKTENNRRTGREKERLAAQFLERKGYVIIQKNFRCRSGEIDIIAREGKYLVFAEVKYRGGSKCGYPEEAVDYRKQKQISKVALYYLKRKRYRLEQPCRFDVVAIVPHEIRLYRNAFEFRG
ncbi:MAG: YraN family protein [Eubacterium sp.]|nr:YraN family protein [Eubacterium sp.]